MSFTFVNGGGRLQYTGTFPTIANTFSWAGWIKIASAPAATSFVWYVGSAGNNRNAAVFCGASNLKGLAWTTSVNNFQNSNITNNFGTGTWHHLGITADWTQNPDVIKIYVDGSSTTGTNSTADSTPQNNVHNFVINGIDGSDANQISADLAEEAGWSVVLTDDEMVALSKGFSPKLIRTAALISYTPLVRETLDHKNSFTRVAFGGSASNHPRIFGA